MIAGQVADEAGVDELGLEVGGGDEESKGLKASAESKLDLGGGILRLRDAWPRFYPPRSSDDSLAIDFVKSIDVLTRRQIKNLIKACNQSAPRSKAYSSPKSSSDR